MRVIVNPRIWRGGYAHQRKSRRLVYVAEILKQFGHEVLIDWRDLPHWEWGNYGFWSRLRPFPKIAGPAEGKCQDADLYVSSNPIVERFPGLLPDCPRIVFKESLNIARDYLLAQRADVIVSYVWHHRDFARSAAARPKFPSGERGDLIRRKILSVPWIPHDRVLELFDAEDGRQPYQADDLAAVRERFGAGEQGEGVGFIGSRKPGREALVERMGYVDATWAGGDDPRLSAANYLWLMSKCAAVPNLPGDTWKCSRFCESILMGAVPVQLAGVMDLDHPVNEENCILVHDWAERAKVESVVNDPVALESVRKGAEASYRAAWSLRAQVAEAVKRAIGSKA